MVDVRQEVNPALIHLSLTDNLGNTPHLMSLLFFSYRTHLLPVLALNTGSGCKSCCRIVQRGRNFYRSGLRERNEGEWTKKRGGKKSVFTFLKQSLGNRES